MSVAPATGAGAQPLDAQQLTEKLTRIGDLPANERVPLIAQALDFYTARAPEDDPAAIFLGLARGLGVLDGQSTFYPQNIGAGATPELSPLVAAIGAAMVTVGDEAKRLRA